MSSWTVSQIYDIIYNNKEQYEPQIIIDKNNKLYVCWWGTNTNYLLKKQIFLRTSSNNGLWWGNELSNDLLTSNLWNYSHSSIRFIYKNEKFYLFWIGQSSETNSINKIFYCDSNDGTAYSISGWKYIFDSDGPLSLGILVDNSDVVHVMFHVLDKIYFTRTHNMTNWTWKVSFSYSCSINDDGFRETFGVVADDGTPYLFYKEATVSDIDKNNHAFMFVKYENEDYWIPQAMISNNIRITSTTWATTLYPSSGGNGNSTICDYNIFVIWCRNKLFAFTESCYGGIFENSPYDQKSLIMFEFTNFHKSFAFVNQNSMFATGNFYYTPKIVFNNNKLFLFADSTNSGIKFKTSDDKGITWSNEISLLSDWVIKTFDVHVYNNTI